MPEVVRVAIESLAYGGEGVGRDPSGCVVFVSGVAPGDVAEVDVRERRRRYARGELHRILEPSPDRVAPPCASYVEGGCGGCQWLHVSAEAQRRAKRAAVVSALRGGAGAVADLAAPVPPLGWRRRARLRWQGREGAPATIGYAARRSHRLVDVAACPQLEAPLDAAFGLVRAHLAGGLRGEGTLELLLGGRGDVHAVLRGPGVRALEPQAKGLLGRIAGLTLADPCGVLRLGADTIDLADEEVPFLAAADVFAQASAAGNEALRRSVRAAVGLLDGQDVLELCAGSGNFTRDLAAGARTVLAVEDHSAAADLGARNARRRGLGDRVTWRAAPAEDVVPALASAGARFDAIVLDPPRTGLPRRAAATLGALGASRIVYVSCDPPTLARDLVLLAGQGYALRRAEPLDLMPQTFHIEVVALLERAYASPSTPSCRFSAPRMRR